MIGKTISHYRILEKLGEGGMGVVYKAEDTKLKRTVALKFLPSELTRDADAKRRFVHEAQAASALQHHNICTIHEIDETPDGLLFICMDFYEGETLREKIGRGPLSFGETMDIVTQASEGLAKAHGAGMVHRDIKPANIMVTKDGVAKIMDFGLAKLAGRTKVTKTGMTVGTVAYMSPEQARGEEMDVRSDVFSLGVTLYEMLAGEPPFKGEHEAALLYEIVHQEYKPLSSYRSDLPEDSQLIIDKMLRKEPGERYQSVLDLKDDLDKLKESSAEGKSLRAERTVISSFLSSRSKLFGGMAATAVVIVLIVFASIQFRQRSAMPSLEELSLAVIDFRNLVNPEDPVASAEITGLLHVGLVEVCPIRVVSPDLLHDLRRRFFGSARGPIAEDQVLEVARKSGSTIFLSGDIKEGQYAVWRLVDTRTGRSLAARRVDGSNMAELANLMIAEVLPLVYREYGIEETPVALSVTTITTASTEAYRHFVAGVLAREDWQPQNAVPRFEQALEYDS
ncbi:MAG: serine/threonine protein kinase, partial [Candidatus Eiseniibacteriota bacterium]